LAAELSGGVIGFGASDDCEGLASLGEGLTSLEIDGGIASSVAGGLAWLEVDGGMASSNAGGLAWLVEEPDSVEGIASLEDDAGGIASLEEDDGGIASLEEDGVS
jgi:hypothetical protein